jgi:HlyD family secretion protein
MKTVARRRLVVWGAVVLVAVTLVAVALMPRPVPVDMATVTRGDLVVTLDHEGRTRVRDRFVVSAPVAGTVLRIQLEPGDQVVAGETVVATFMPGTPTLLDERSRAEANARVKAVEAAVRNARAERERIRALMEHAQSELARTRNLFDEGVVPRRGLEVAEAEAAALSESLKSADAAVEAATHELEAARAALLEPRQPSANRAGRAVGTAGVMTLRSPTDGVVLRRIRESEAVVPQGEPLLEIGDTARMEIIADFLSSDAVRMQPGMPVLIDRWGGGRAIDGHVRRVEPAGFLKISALGVEEQRVWVVIDFDDPAEAAQALGDGFRVEARVVIWQRPDVVQVPTSALFRAGGAGATGGRTRPPSQADGWAVFVVEDGRARLRQVEIGQRNGLAAEVLSGLAEGERIIEHPADDVSDGVRVVLRQT